MAEIINSQYDEREVEQAVAGALEKFYQSLISKIDSININDILKSKNPYLYRAKSMQSAHDIIESIMQAFVSSSEETIFGNEFFEPIAIAASNGMKSTAEGIDIDLENRTKNIKYAVAVKSGTSVFNADSKKRQEENFASAAKRARQAHMGFAAIVGYAYGTKKETNRGNAKIYEELAGEDFWTVITGDPLFYKKIISFMGTLPEQYIEKYKESYTRAENRLIRAFSGEFCKPNGAIDWEKLVEYNSGSLKRKEREQRQTEIQKIYTAIQANPTISKKALAAQCKITMSHVNFALKWLLEEGCLQQGYQEKPRGWTAIHNPTF